MPIDFAKITLYKVYTRQCSYEFLPDFYKKNP